MKQKARVTVIKHRIEAWLMALAMVFSVVMIPGGVAKAESKSAWFEFQGGSLDGSNNCVNYTVDNKTVSVQVGTRSGDSAPYVFTPINISGEHNNPEASFTDESGVLSGYFFKITNTEAADINVLVNGSNLTFESDSTEWIPLGNVISYSSGNAIMAEIQNDNGNNGGGNPQNSSYTISLGEDKIVENGVIVNNKLGITINGAGVELKDCNYSGVDLIIDGNPSLDVVGINNFRSVQLTNGSGFEMWGRMSGDFQYDDMESVDKNDNNIESNYGQLVLAEGVTGPETGMAGTLSLRDSLIIKIGTVDTPADNAFKNINNVIFWNYDFHDRKANNSYIYAATAFKKVNYVEVQSAKIKVNAGTKLFDKDTLDNNIDCVMFQEGVLKMTGTIGDGTLESKYYKSYPADNGKSGFLASHENAGDAGEPYVTSKEITETTTVDNSAIENGAYKLTVVGDTITIESKDVILYSVSYTIDDGIGIDNPNAGSVTMDGFKKGYYIFDDKDGHFEAWIAAGEAVNVTILPNTGYQYIKGTLNINGTPIENVEADGDTVGQYSFIMPANAGHMCAGFIKTDDVVNVASGAAVSNVSISGTENVIENGNAELNVTQATVSDSEKNTIAAQVNNSNAEYEYVDLSLNEYVVKNYDESKEVQEAWETKLTELKDEVSITLDIPDDLSGASSYQVVRLHEGEANVLPVTHSLTNNTLKFDTDKFSTYAIVANRYGDSSTQTGLNYSTPSSGTVKLDGTTVTIENAVISGDGYSELCLYGKEYGKTPMTLVVKGTNTVDTLIFDTAVTVVCEEGASLTFNASKSDLEADNTEYTGTKGSYTLGANTVLEGNVFKYKAAASGGGEQQPAQPAQPAVNPPAAEQPATTEAPKTEVPKAAEVGATITDTSTGGGTATATYTVTEKSEGAGDTGEVTYTGESADSTATSVVIPATVTGADGTVYEVTKIAENALKDNKTVKEVTVGDNIEEIGAGAFQNATNLTTVKLGKKVAKIDKNSFAGCTKLKKVTSSGSAVTSIGESAFKGDKALTSVDFSKSKVKTIGKNAFNGDKKLNTIKINGNAITKVGKGAFKNIKKKATITIYAKDKKTYNKVVKLIKKSGASSVKYKYKKKK